MIPALPLPTTSSAALHGACRPGMGEVVVRNSDVRGDKAPQSRAKATVTRFLPRSVVRCWAQVFGQLGIALFSITVVGFVRVNRLEPGRGVP